MRNGRRCAPVRVSRAGCWSVWQTGKWRRKLCASTTKCRTVRVIPADCRGTKFAREPKFSPCPMLSRLSRSSTAHAAITARCCGPLQKSTPVVINSRRNGSSRSIPSSGAWSNNKQRWIFIVMDNTKEATPDISAFLASSIHYMKNSLGLLINFLETSLPELGLDTQKKAAPMLYEVKRVNDNLLQMLAIFKVGNQFYPFDLSENFIDDFVREIVEQNKTMLDYSGIALDVEFDEGLAWYFDRELIIGVVSPALNNATRY